MKPLTTQFWQDSITTASFAQPASFPSPLRLTTAGQHSSIFVTMLEQCVALAVLCTRPSLLASPGTDAGNQGCAQKAYPHVRIPERNTCDVYLQDMRVLHYGYGPPLHVSCQLCGTQQPETLPHIPCLAFGGCCVPSCVHIDPAVYQKD